MTKSRESFSTWSREETNEYHKEIYAHSEYYGKFDKALKDLAQVKLPVDPGKHFFTWTQINEHRTWQNKINVRELLVWCEENAIEGEYNDAGVLFYREEDAVKFKLQCIIEG